MKVKSNGNSYKFHVLLTQSNRTRFLYLFLMLYDQEDIICAAFGNNPILLNQRISVTCTSLTRSILHGDLIDSVILSFPFFWFKEITRVKFVTYQGSFAIVNVNGSKTNIVSLHRKETQFRSFVSFSIFAMRKWNSNFNVYILFH